ncbi:MAG: hypothetical protein K0U84_08700 [Actinomycetia bacterium]|nr:hypothetical protein [Actinomycetes bacterium]
MPVVGGAAGALAGAAGGYGALIVTPDMVPPDPAGWDALGQQYQAGAAAWERIYQQIVRDNAARREAADSRGFDTAHQAGAILAEEAKTISEWHQGAAKKANGISGVFKDTAAAQEQLVRDANAKIQAAKLPGEREALVTAYHSQARVQTGWGVTAATALHTSFKTSTENTRALSLLTKFGDVSTAPPATPLDNTSPGIEQGDNSPWEKRVEDGNYREPTASPPSDPASSPAIQSGFDAVDQGAGAAKGAPVGGHGSKVQSPAASGGAPAPSMSNLGELLSGGGMSSGGTPSMPGGLGSGGMPGVGSTPLGAGLGEMPGAAGGLAGAGGMPGSASSASSPASAFSRGMATGAGMGGGVPTMPPSAPASPSPALSAGGTAVPAVPVSAAGAGGGVSGVAAQPGMAAPAAPAATTGAGMGGAPMMMPPGAMGPPAAAVPPAAAPTAPAGAGAGAGSGHAAAAPSASAAGGATLVPASVVAAGQTAAARERQESADAAAAKELVWKLQHAAGSVNSAGTDWAVGVFRSPSGTETVMTTNDGASFVPHSVHVPRSARLLSADPLVDEHFRQLWFGWHDPARVLVEYARLRSETDWRLVAAATTGPVTALRDEGVEHPPSCSRDVNPLLRAGEGPVSAPPLDGLHVHRLSLLWPEVYPRLQRVMEADPVYQERIVNAVSALMLNTATTQAVAIEGGIPEAFRRVWSTRGAPSEPNAQEWAAYDEQAPRFNIQVAMARPGFLSGAEDPSETVDEVRNYRAHWLVARTAEHIAGWSTRPLPLPDMCYSALALEQPHIRDLIEEALSSVEDDLRGTGT